MKPPKPACSVDGCDTPIKYTLYCEYHGNVYRRTKRVPTLSTVPIPTYILNRRSQSQKKPSSRMLSSPYKHYLNEYLERLKPTLPDPIRQMFDQSEFMVINGQGFCLMLPNRALAEQCEPHRWMIEERLTALAREGIRFRIGHRCEIGCCTTNKSGTSKELSPLEKSIKGITIPRLPLSGQNVVYRHLISGLVVYVGITNDFMTRQKAHAKDKPWFRDVTQIGYDLYSTYDELAPRETCLILALQPVYNKAQNDPLRSMEFRMKNTGTDLTAGYNGYIVEEIAA